MKQKYIYAYNGFMNFARGFGVLPELRSRVVAPVYHPDKVFVWRNHVTDGYKIGLYYQDSPMDLSNYLLIRTRERIVLENKIANPKNVMKRAKLMNWQRNTNESFLKEVNKDIEEHLVHLHRLLTVSTGKEDVPVAFAANALYVLERNNVNYNKEEYYKILLPVILNKIENLHAEGIA
jgi:hypothetical protein